MIFVCSICNLRYESHKKDLYWENDNKELLRQRWHNAVSLLMTNNEDSYYKKELKCSNEYFNSFGGTGVYLIPDTLISCKENNKYILKCRTH